jgi:hypothetical protein
MNANSSQHQRQKRVKGKVDTRGAGKRKLKISCLGEPGRFSVVGYGMKVGVHHFSC